MKSRTNAGMITRSRKSLRVGSMEPCVSQLASDLRGSRLPSGARGISSSQTIKPLPCTRSDVCRLPYFFEFAIPRWQKLGDGNPHSRRQFFEPAAVTVCVVSCMVYVYSTVKRRLQRRNAVREARAWKAGDSASPAVLIRTRRLISPCPVFRIWQERNQELWPGLCLECVASEAAEWGYGRSVDSILSKSFGRKSQVRGHPARL